MGFNRDDRGRGGSYGRRDFGGRGGFNRGGDRGSSRPMYKTTCSNCGNECEVPFRPTTGKPVYCSNCFEKMGGGNKSDSPRQQRSDYRPQSSDNNKVLLDSINAKLDKILNLLQPKVEPDVAKETVVVPPVVVESKELKTLKVKKSSKKSAVTEAKDPTI